MPLALSLENLASQADLDAHLADTSAAHAASAISFTPTGTIAATDVQAAIAEVASEASGGGVEALADPGATWQAETAYTEGDRIGVVIELESGVTEVFEASGGTSDTGEPSWEDVSQPLDTVADNDIDWTWIGQVGRIGFRDYARDPRIDAYATSIFNLEQKFGTEDVAAPGDAGLILYSASTTQTNWVSLANVLDNVDIIATGTDDPTAGGGIGGAIGKLYTRDNSGTGELWLKTGAADDAWSKVF